MIGRYGEPSRVSGFNSFLALKQCVFVRPGINLECASLTESSLSSDEFVISSYHLSRSLDNHIDPTFWDDSLAHLVGMVVLFFVMLAYLTEPCICLKQQGEDVTLGMTKEVSVSTVIMLSRSWCVHSQVIVVHSSLPEV